jgi:cobalt-precorrin-5B (C1)-methyltransferase
MLKFNRSGTLKYGYTTGSCAAAASKAALQYLLTGEYQDKVTIDLPDGGNIDIAINRIDLQDGQASAEVIKDAGDDPDVTHGVSVFSTVELVAGGEIIIDGGAGVGRVTKPGLAIPVGQAAINPVPRAMIRKEISKVLPAGQGAKIIISVPEGEKLAARTMNPRLGITGGISIIGTSGIVRPMSENAYVDSLLPQISQAIALGHKILVLTPGGMGAKKAAELGITEDAVILTSNFIGELLQECALRQVEGILLLGHIGKLIKVAGGIFNTHSHIADARREILAAHAAMLGAPPDLIKEIMTLNTMEASLNLMKSCQMEQVYHSIAAAASRRCHDIVEDKVKTGTVMYALNGDIIGYDTDALELGRMLKWKIKLK